MANGKSQFLHEPPHRCWQAIRERTGAKAVVAAASARQDNAIEPAAPIARGPYVVETNIHVLAPVPKLRFFGRNAN